MSANLYWCWRKFFGNSEDSNTKSKESNPVVPFKLCPFQHNSGNTDQCAGVECQLWSISMPFSAAEKNYPNGMCSIKLMAEAQAFLSRGNELGGLEGK